MLNTADPISTADTAYTVFTTVVLLTKFHPYFENFVQSGGRWPTQVHIVKSCSVGREASLQSHGKRQRSIGDASHIFLLETGKKEIKLPISLI